MSERAYGAPVAWEPTVAAAAARCRLIVSWIVGAASVYIAAGIVGGVSIDNPGGRAAGRRGDRADQRGAAAGDRGAAAAVHARHRLPAGPVRRRRGADAHRRALPRGARDRLLRRRPARVAGDGGGLDRAPGADRDQRRRRVHAAGDQAGRRGARAARPAPTPPGSSSSRSTASRCRSCATRCATAAPRTWPAGSPRAATGSREWETDLSSQTGRQPGRDPARLERGHPRLPLGREGDRRR